MRGFEAGRLRHRIRIERASEIDDGSGGQIRTWFTLATIWANATPTGGREGLIAGTLQASQGWRVEIRPTNVTTKDRIILIGNGNKVLNIRSAEDPDGLGQRMVLLCDTGVGG